MKFVKSQELLNKALKIIPNATQTMSKCYNQWAKGTVPNYIIRAEGVYMYDADGNRFIDTMAALGPILLGYNYPEVQSAMIKQMKYGSVFSLSSSLEVELAETLTDIIPCCEMVRFGKNGSDVTSIAVRIARAYTGKEHILSVKGHYHGWSDFYAASSSLNKGLPESTKTLVDHFEYNDLNSLVKKLETGMFAAVIMEPCRVHMPEPGFLEGVRALCDYYGVILIFDEVVTSFRWSLGGAQQYYGVVPDIAAVGKAMSNGMPVSALVGKKEFMQELSSGGVFFSGTYLGETISIAASLATIEILRKNEQEIYNHLWGKSLEYKNAFNDYCAQIGLDAEMVGFGPVLHIKFNTNDPGGCKDVYCKYMAKNGIFAGPAVYITWAHKDKHIEKMIRASRISLDEVKRVSDSNTIDKELDGSRSFSIFKESVSKNP